MHSVVTKSSVVRRKVLHGAAGFMKSSMIVGCKVKTLPGRVNGRGSLEPSNGRN